MKLTRNEWMAIALSAGGLGLMWLLTREVGNLWYRLAIFYAVLVPASLLLVRLEWKALFKFKPQHALWGVVGAAVLYGAGLAGAWLMRQFWPDGGDAIERVYAMLADKPGWQIWPLLVWIIAGEEVVWRQAATQPFVARLKFWAAPLAGLLFMVVHLPWAPPLLCAASLVFGTAWSWMAVRSKSFWLPFVSHILWDVLVMFAARLD